MQSFANPHLKSRHSSPRKLCLRPRHASRNALPMPREGPLNMVYLGSVTELQVTVCSCIILRDTAR
jgi:hypothetical protein